jgi:hypothetical protein
MDIEEVSLSSNQKESDLFAGSIPWIAEGDGRNGKEHALNQAPRDKDDLKCLEPQRIR